MSVDPHTPDHARETVGTERDLPAAATGAAGHLSERYTVVEELGTGANGRVVAARDRVLDRVVAVKMLIQGDSLETARFIREARITAALEHPNIVPLHDLEFPAVGNINFIMRRVVGMTLGVAIQRAQAGQVPPAIATTNDLLTLILKVCDALARAHARGVIHQDVKPDNIMLGEHGEVVLVDWGEARLSGESTVGKPSQVVGTPIYMSPEQAQGERADERSDVYCLGASLFHALLLRYPTWHDEPERFWQKKREGLIDLPSAEEQRQVPRRLLAIMLTAMAADPLARYQSIQALSEDLTAFQAGQAVQAYRESPLERLARWVGRHRAPLAATLGVLLVLGGGLWWLWGEKLKESASWGKPIAVENFADGSWRTRWVEHTPGMFTTKDGQLVSTAERSARIAFRHRLQTPVAIEYYGQILPGSIPCDLSVWWNEGQSPFNQTETGGNPHGYMIQAGAYSDQFCAIYRQENGERLAQTPFKLASGQTYHMRVEIDDTRVAMWIDGRLIVEHTDLFPATSGFLSLYAYFPGKAFSNLRIWEKGVAEKVPVLAIGDAALQAGAWELAAAQYQRIADSRAGEALGDQARYRQGLALLKAGQTEAADAIWKEIPEGPERDRVTCHDIDKLQAAGHHQEAATAMTALYLRAPWVRAQLRSQWMRYLIYEQDPEHHPQLINAYLAVKDQAFPDDTSTVYQYGQGLNSLHRYREALARFPHEPIVACNALASLGRDREILTMFSDIPDMRADALLRMGNYDEVVKIPSLDPWPMMLSLDKSGRTAEAAARFPDQAQALIGDGKAELVVQQPLHFKEFQVTALMALGRWQQAAEVLGPDGKPDPMALQLLGRDREAYALATPSPDMRLLLAALAGDHATATACQNEILAEAPDYLKLPRWFGYQLMTPFLAGLNGDLGPWHKLLATGSALPTSPDTDLRHVYSQRLWYASALLRGEIDDARFLAQPTVSEAPALLLLLRGMEAELAGEQATAVQRYRAFKALPLTARLLYDWRPNPMIERFVAWRLALLAK